MRPLTLFVALLCACAPPTEELGVSAQEMGEGGNGGTAGAGGSGGTGGTLPAYVEHDLGAVVEESAGVRSRYFANHVAPHSTSFSAGINPHKTNAGHMSLSFGLESNYQPFAGQSVHWAEWYVQFHSEPGASFLSRRPIQGHIDRGTGDASIEAWGESFRWKTSDGTTDMGRINSSQGHAPPRWELPAAGYLAQMTPASPVVTGMGTTGGLYVLLSTNAANETVLGQGGGQPTRTAGALIVSGAFGANGAVPQGQAPVTGATCEAALSSLLTRLEAMGLIADHTSLP